MTMLSEIKTTTSRSAQTASLLSSTDDLFSYCSLTADDDVEQFRVLYLDGEDQLISDDCICTGRVNRTSVYPRPIVARALELATATMVFVHNDPSAGPGPSEDGIATLKMMQQVCATIGLAVRDHIVIGDGRPVSLRSRGYFI